MKLPTYVQIEPVGQCNLRCQMCSIQFRKDGPPFGPPALDDRDESKYVMNDPFVPKLLSRLPVPPHKIILLRASRIGDFLSAKQAFSALRMDLQWPDITSLH